MLVYIQIYTGIYIRVSSGDHNLGTSYAKKLKFGMLSIALDKEGFQPKNIYYFQQQTSGFKLAQKFREKGLLPPDITGRSFIG